MKPHTISSVEELVNLVMENTPRLAPELRLLVHGVNIPEDKAALLVSPNPVLVENAKEPSTLRPIVEVSLFQKHTEKLGWLYTMCFYLDGNLTSTEVMKKIKAAVAELRKRSAPQPAYSSENAESLLNAYTPTKTTWIN